MQGWPELVRHKGVIGASALRFLLMEPLCDSLGCRLDFLCTVPHFVTVARSAMEYEMAHFLTAHSKHFAALYQGEAKHELGDYQFGRRHETYDRGRSAFHRASGYLKALINSMADARFRRMLRELGRGGRYLDMRDELWVPDALRDRDTTK